MGDKPLAFLITFTCYGTWLHGDQRGSVDYDHNVFETPLLDYDPKQTVFSREKMKHLLFLLDEERRKIVDDTIVEVCEHRKWNLLQRNVRSNHAHVVVSAQVDPDKIMGDLKAYATRRLRESRQLEPNRPAWTEGGSTRYLWTEDSVKAAIEYVRNQ